MEEWRQCCRWLSQLRVLSSGHRAVCSGEVFDLAQALRDGVLLCQLLHRLSPDSICLRDINMRPQMSQFLCLKNIRTFLGVCHDMYGLRKSELFDAFDLFDVRDFGKVISTLSKLSHHHVCQAQGIRPFPQEEITDCGEDIYKSLEEMADEQDMEDADDLYDCVPIEDDCGDIYDDVMKMERRTLPDQGTMSEEDKRCCCVQEIRQSEEKYLENLENIERNFLIPLRRVLSARDIETIFINLEELLPVHRAFLAEIRQAVQHAAGRHLHEVFLSFKPRLLIYASYCSRLESAQSCLDNILQSRDDIRKRLEECTLRYNGGKFALRDLLVVPMQRVLKYHLLLKELLKHTMEPACKPQVKNALEAMEDLAFYVNEVKRDNETLKQIAEIEKSFDGMVPLLQEFGRPKMDGDIKVVQVGRARQDRFIFLFDKAVLMCKKKGDNFELKQVLDLYNYKITDDPTSNRDSRKWTHSFYLTPLSAGEGFQFLCKTEELKKKWVKNFEMALSNLRPTCSYHDFHMHTFRRPAECQACHLLLRGLFYQGYNCKRCGVEAHKECLEKTPACQRPLPPNPKQATEDTASSPLLRVKNPPNPPNPNGLRIHKMAPEGPHLMPPPLPPQTYKIPGPALPQVQAIQIYRGCPSPPNHLPPLLISTGEVLELTHAEPDAVWWEGRSLSTQQIGYFPRDCVKPVVKPNKQGEFDCYQWFVGVMGREQANASIVRRPTGTYLVRERPGEPGEFAISIKFNTDVKHIKIVIKDAWFHITEQQKFRGLVEMVEYYQTHSLKEGFRALDTRLQHPFRLGERSCTRASPCSVSGIVGTAVARRSFLARDLRELTLHTGDLVKIYSCNGGSNGWWKGEVDGRIGWFPSTYVEEEGV
uniref:guanine nucleotide exchange factor VAV2-like isoform X2 n=1 Tax=Myxine glutinosa TaxID=7769 RepID=UPI00358FD963